MKPITRLWHRFTRPIASDPDQARGEYTTRLILTMMGLTLLVSAIPITGGWVIGAFEPNGIVIIAMLNLAIWSGWGLAQVGRWRWARYIPPIAILAPVVYTTRIVPYSNSGIQLAMLAVVLTALLFGKKAQWLMTGLSLSVYLTGSWIWGIRDPEELLMAGTVASAAFTGLSLLLWLLIILFERAINRSRTYAAELYETNEKLRAMFMSATDGITFVDLQGIVVDVNDAAAQIHRYPGREALIGKNVLDLFGPAERERAQEVMQQLLKQASTGIVQYKLLHADGTEFDGELSGAVVRDHQGQPRGYLGLTRDITARVQAEQERTRLVTAIEQAGESVLITDTGGTILYVNPAFERTSGYSIHEIVGQTPNILQSGEQDAAFYREMWATLQDGTVWQGRLVNRHKNGTLYTEEATISPVRDEMGQVRNYVAVKRDITHELDLRERYQQAQKMEAVGRLASGIAHDFNNLLTAVQGYTRLLLDDLDAGRPSDLEDRQSMCTDLNQILEAANRAAGLTRQLLAFSRKQVLQPQIIDLNAILQGMQDMLHRLIGEHIEFTMIADPHLAPVRADPNQIEQVIMNLAVNARDAMPEGGRLVFQTENRLLPPAQLSLAQRDGGSRCVVLSVSDTGMGMSPEVRAHIFEPFFTTKPEGKGTGLGLATVYGIVEQSGGRIEVESEPGAGTTFRIYLPPVQDQPLPDRCAQPHEKLSLGSGTILLVEDEEPVRELARRVLERSGYTVLSASHSQEAWALSTQYNGEIEMMITDVVMPGGGGRELAMRITAQRPEIKVLYISGYTDDAVLHDLVREAHTAFLQKPFTPAVLARQVRQVLAGTAQEKVSLGCADPSSR